METNPFILNDLFHNYKFLCVFSRIEQRLGEWCRAETLHRTASRPSQRMVIRSSLTALTLLSRPEPTTSPEMSRRRSGTCADVQWEFSSSFIYFFQILLSFLIYTAGLEFQFITNIMNALILFYIKGDPHLFYTFTINLVATWCKESHMVVDGVYLCSHHCIFNDAQLRVTGKYLLCLSKWPIYIIST